MKLIKTFFSFEAVFVLWLFSYQFKNAYPIFNSPDITVLLTCMLIPWSVLRYFKNPLRKQIPFWNQHTFLFLVMSLWFIITSFWSPSHFYKLQKTLCYAFYNIPGFLIGYLVISQDKDRINKLLASFVIFSVIVGLQCLRAFWEQGMHPMLEVMNTNYLVTGQTLGVGFLILISWSFFLHVAQQQEQNPGLIAPSSKGLQKLKLAINLNIGWFLTLLVSSVFFYILINLGGRGPVIASVVSVIVFYAACMIYSSFLKTIPHLSMFLVLSTLCYIFFNSLFGHESSYFSQRIAPFLHGQMDRSLLERVSYYQSAFHVFLQHPLGGVGFGGWPMTQGLADISFHPHNIFFELLSETGVIGFILFLAFLIDSLKNLKFTQVFSMSRYASVFLVTLFSFINALKTGDLHDNLLLFVSLSLCAGISSHFAQFDDN